ncbi:MAG TPA: SemiSWEET transporter [Acidobacteriaceae bacterium]|nr:SemiSWEET transporter [Acidobacteriaceae bacterium]
MTAPVLLLAADFTGVAAEYLGYAAACCTTAAFVPQLVRVIRTRSARDISLPTFLLFSVGVFLWLLYGLYTGSKPVIASNAVTLVLSVGILILKLRYDRSAMKELKP